MRKSQKIKEELLRYIDTLIPNDKILSRAVICKKWNISRATADKVIAELQQEGIVYCVKGSGTYVAPREGSMEEISNASPKYRWAILVPDMSFDLYPKAFSGIFAFAESHNIDFLVCCTGDAVSTEYAFMQHITTSEVDGMIIIPAIRKEDDRLNDQFLSKLDIPYVFWQRSVDSATNVPQVLLNGYYGGYIATKHLIEQGYRRIAYLAYKKFRSSMDRYMGYCAALSEAGLELDQSLVKIGIDLHNSHCSIRRMLTQPEPADGFVCFVDSLAVDVVQTVRECGLRISEDVGVIGFEGVISRLDAMLDIQLTYVDISFRESGQAASEILWEMMHDKSMNTQILKIISPKLVIRDSCKGKSTRENTTTDNQRGNEYE